MGFCDFFTNFFIFSLLEPKVFKFFSDFSLIFSFPYLCFLIIFVAGLATFGKVFANLLRFARFFVPFAVEHKYGISIFWRF